MKKTAEEIANAVLRKVAAADSEGHLRKIGVSAGFLARMATKLQKPVSTAVRGVGRGAKTVARGVGGTAMPMGPGLGGSNPADIMRGVTNPMRGIPSRTPGPRVMGQATGPVGPRQPMQPGQGIFSSNPAEMMSGMTNPALDRFMGRG